MKKIIATLFVALLAIVPAAAQKTITVNGTARSFVEYVPANLGSKRPLLISCHGMNQDANYQKGMLKVETLADKEKFVTVFPEGINRGWDISGDRDINFILAIIDRMVADYDIDRNRVYLSGFSMGGMLTYHAMTKIADKIAAFAPISGMPMGGMSYTSKRPVPIIHTHGTTDDVVAFNRVQPILDGWIERNKCSKTPTTTKSYKGYAHATKHVWGGGTDGVQVVLLEFANKGHWISNDGLYTCDEIWNFCKNYSLEENPVKVTITSPKNGETTGSEFTITAEATSAKADITSVNFYIDGYSVGSDTEVPFECAVRGRTKGNHTIIALATDANGKKNSTNIKINVDPEATGIGEIATDGQNADGAVHNIGGQRVDKMQKGQIYIVGGKKVLGQ